MKWNAHWDVVRQSKHALLGASKWHWINYPPEKVPRIWEAFQQAQHGTELHAFAADCIRLREKLAKKKRTLNLYVNDAIGYLMDPEVVLYYSDNCFGTADAISFRNNLLRIHDLKTGEIPAHIEQLEIYAALFCLEYHYKPADIDIELRIYQNNEVAVYEPTPEEILKIMDRIVEYDKIIEMSKEE